MILTFKNFLITESIKNIDLTKLITIVKIDKDDNGNWIYITDDNKEYYLPKEKENVITVINDRFADFVNNNHSITKYFETEEDGRTIKYASNFAVDIIALKDKEIYLIERKDGKGWALPGGFIDAGEVPKESALREFQEECLVNLYDIEKITALNIVRCNDSREINFFTYPFVFNMKDTTELNFADDAKNGKWISIEDALNSKLAFTHHTEIIHQISKMI